MSRPFPIDLKIVNVEFNPDHDLLGSFQGDAGNIELSKGNIEFLLNLFMRFKPSSILECGVSAGGSSALFLYLLDTVGSDGQLFSVDIAEKWYRDKSLDTGWAAKKIYPQKNNWHLITGKLLPEIIEKLDTNFDFCFLDTAHRLPGELLDFLVVLPFMNEGGIIAVHDTLLHIIDNNDSYANLFLINSCVGNKFYSSQENIHDASIAAVQITSDTFKYVADLFSATRMRWSYPLSDKHFYFYYNFFLKYYGNEAAAWFAQARSWNNNNLLRKKPATSQRQMTDGQILKIIARSLLKNLLPYGLIRFIQTHRN